jgi:hypothetical protein
MTVMDAPCTIRVFDAAGWSEAVNERENANSNLVA